MVEWTTTDAVSHPPTWLGEGGRPCPACSADQAVVWSDRHWRLKQLGGESGVPLLLVLESIAHHDLADLPEDRAAELGLLTVRIVRAIEALPHITRAHVSRWGDGGAHLHDFFFARPAGFPPVAGHLPGDPGRSAARGPGRPSRPRRGRRRQRARRARRSRQGDEDQRRGDYC